MAAYARCCTTVLFIILCIIYPGISSVISLSLEHWCICNGSAATFECVVTGGDTTTWQGTALQNCSNGNNIILRHSQFSSEDEYLINGTCGDTGLVFGRAISVVNNSYTSQLIITNFNQYNILYHHTVKCTSSNQGSLNSSTVILLTESIAPTINVILTNVYNGKITFTVAMNSLCDENCPKVCYNINSTDCGECPETVTSNIITCDGLNVTNGQRLCSVAVQPVVNGTIQGHFTEPITLLIEGSTDKTVISELVDNFVGSNIKRMFLEIKGSEAQLNDTIYIVRYTTNSTVHCRSVNIPHSSCENEICSDTFDVSSSNCSLATEIKVSVNLTSQIGNQSDTVTAVNTDYKTSGQLIHINNNSNVLISAVITCSLGILFLAGVVVILFFILIKVYHRVSTNCPSVITDEEPVTLRMTERDHESILNESIIFVESTNSLDRSQNNEVEPVSNKKNGDTQLVIYENNFNNIDNSLNLDSLLIQIRSQVTPKWYQFGVAVSISKETLDELSSFPPEECVVEVLDLWLRRRETAATWRDVADVLKQIGLYLLAEKMLKIYKTGVLPTNPDMDIHMQNCTLSSNTPEHVSNL